MKRTVPVVLQALLTGLILLSSGCKPPPRPMQFSNMMARGNKALSEAAEKFFKAIEPLSKNSPATSNLQTAYNGIESTLKGLRQDFASISPPLGSPPGRDLLEAYRDFLKTEQSIFDNCITPIYQTAQGNGSNAAKWKRIEPLLGRASDEEKSASAALKAAHKEYMAHHNLEAKTR